ncbi:MAG: PQQ-binding-like beta-propeller repeat protein, partial [Candidatus Bathyarchaeia archaeon]
LWIKNYTAPPGNITVQFGPVDPVSRVFFMSHKETMQWEGYDLDKSNKLWGPVGKTRDINFYPASVGMGFSGQIGFVAYGKLYTAGYGGELFCYDSRTGTLLWKYNNTDSGLETPWGLYPLFIGSIADGKVYIYSNEHSPNAPLYKGYKVRCINASTGEELWTLLGWAGVGSFADCGWPVADGYLVYFNSYDGQLYCLGRGPTATTVEVSPATVSTGSYVVIRGSVIDISPGTKQHEQAARFPNGVPAVADECMGPWMEYVYMQKPMPANAKGVWVKLDAVNVYTGEYIDIGGTCTDPYTGIFTVSWQPSKEGLWWIIARFPGSKSYWPSFAQKSVMVTAPPEAPAAPAYTTMDIAIITAVIIAIIIGIANLYIMLKKK